MLRYILAIISCGVLFRISRANPQYGAGILILLFIMFVVKTNSTVIHNHSEIDPKNRLITQN